MKVEVGEEWRRRFLIICLVLVVGSTGALLAVAEPVQSAVDKHGSTTLDRENVDGLTVVTTQKNPSGPGQLLAYNDEGELVFSEKTRHSYFDVDPSPSGWATVMVVAADKISKQKCGTSNCYRNYIERVNLSTGERTVLHTELSYGKGPNRWHDVDRVGPNKYIVADIESDQAFIVDTETGIRTWSWSARQEWGIFEKGGKPTDWTHLNDVELLPDGRIMVSLRNHDKVVFINRTTGVQHSWTLGEDGNHERLFEQHNPDYIPSQDGGPAVIVADSENDRVVEYQRENGEWIKTWSWSDSELSWPRDADRLPNGNTLITDSVGGRIVEVNEAGNVVWSVHVGMPYEAERLGTGDESTGGPSANAAGLESRTANTGWESMGWEERVKSLFPAKIVHGLKFITPAWVGVGEFGLIFLDLCGFLGLVSIRVFPYLERLEVRWPIRFVPGSEQE